MYDKKVYREKNELRKQYLQIRKETKDKEIKSKQICRLLAAQKFFSSASTIALYSSLRNEVNIRYLAETIFASGKCAVFPKVEGEGCMSFYRTGSLKELTAGGAFGISEPEGIKNTLVKKEAIDLMIIPGICFDTAKNRIGFGRGYYDRYLMDAPHIIKVGVCFSDQLLCCKNEDFMSKTVEFIDADKNDIRMDFLVTENGLL